MKKTIKKKSILRNQESSKRKWKYVPEKGACGAQTWETLMGGESEGAGDGVVEVEMMKWLFGEAFSFDFTVYGKFL